MREDNFILSKSFGPVVVAAIVALFCGMFALTMTTIRTPVMPLKAPDSPLGYSISNLQWLIPALGIVLLYFAIKIRPSERRALQLTLFVLPFTGFILDIFFADRFFTFPNTKSVWGLSIPGFNFRTLAFDAPIPIEEFIFYITGFLYTLAVYLFGRDIWLSRYTPPCDAVPRGKWRPLAASFVVLVLVVLGFLAKALFKTPGESVVPEYYLFLILLGIGPCIFLYPIVYRRVNWQALSFTLFSVLLISVIWEVTMGIPYGWWGYHREVMMGIFIKPWFDLPLESAIVWLTVSFTTIFTFEAIVLAIKTRGSRTTGAAFL